MRNTLASQFGFYLLGICYRILQTSTVFWNAGHAPVFRFSYHVLFVQRMHADPPYLSVIQRSLGRGRSWVLRQSNLWQAEGGNLSTETASAMI